MDESDLLAFYYFMKDAGAVFTDEDGKELSPEEMVKRQTKKKKKKNNDDERNR